METTKEIESKTYISRSDQEEELEIGIRVRV